MAVGDFDGPLLTKTDYAYAALRKRIMSGALPHGSAVSQEALAAELNVSTTPLREAMRRLASEGLVILDAHRDARVAGERRREWLIGKRARCAVIEWLGGHDGVGPTRQRTVARATSSPVPSRTTACT